MVGTFDVKGLDTSARTESRPSNDTARQDIDGDLGDANLLRLAQEAESQAITFFQSGIRTYWARSYKAFRSQHFDGSKYHAAEFRGRSKYFRPKTRIAVLKSMAHAAQALFSTGDVIAISPQNEADDYQVASAALKQELMNYRLSRVSRKNGIRWFLTAMGALQTAKIAGIVISKQSWKYREDDEAASYDAEGNPSEKPAILEDRPSIDLIPPENCLFDQNCDWTNPAQSSAFMIIRNPMSVDEAWTMIEQNIGTGRSKFRKNITKDDLRNRAQSTPPSDTTAPRAAREGGRDPMQQTSGSFGRVWMNEVFMRIGNLDVVYWTLDNGIVLSGAVPVRKAYPPLSGERPIVVGFGAIEAFRPTPQSPVESWQQMQMETNDQANLRMDHMKNVVSPVAKVVRGKKVDLTQVQRRGPNGIVMVQDSTDVEWWEPPDVPQSAFVENNILNADFDSLAAVFDSGSVANNRSMNETVGGMRLLASATSPMADFDLQLFVETWAEVALWQVLKFLEFYENDATILAIAGEKAKLWERFGIDKVTDELLTRETSLTIKLGVGSNNLPEDRIRRFANAWQVAMQAIMPSIEAKIISPPKIKVKEIIDTIFGAAGFGDGGERFFENLDGAQQPAQQPGPDPIAQGEQQLKAQKLQLDAEKNQMDTQVKILDLQHRAKEAMTKVEIEHMRTLAEIGKAFMEQGHAAALQGREHAHADHGRMVEHAHGVARDQINRDNDLAIANFQSEQQPQQTGAPGQ